MAEPHDPIADRTTPDATTAESRLAEPDLHDSASADGADAAGTEAAGHTPPALGDASSVLGQAMVDLARVVLRRSRKGAKRAASSGRVRLDLRQLRRDRDVMYQKLGREVRHLVEGGDVRHPGLVRGVERIQQLEARVAAVEQELAERHAAELAVSIPKGAAEVDDARQDRSAADAHPESAASGDTDG